MKITDYTTLTDQRACQGMPIGRARVYFYDLDSRKQLDHPAYFDLAQLGYATIGGKYQIDTIQGVEAVDLSTMRKVEIRPREGRKIAVKLWHPELTPTWKRLLASDGSSKVAQYGQLADRSDIRECPIHRASNLSEVRLERSHKIVMYHACGCAVCYRESDVGAWLEASYADAVMRSHGVDTRARY